MTNPHRQGAVWALGKWQKTLILSLAADPGTPGPSLSSTPTGQGPSTPSLPSTCSWWHLGEDTMSCETDSRDREGKPQREIEDSGRLLLRRRQLTVWSTTNPFSSLVSVFASVTQDFVLGICVSLCTPTVQGDEVLPSLGGGFTLLRKRMKRGRASTQTAGTPLKKPGALGGLGEERGRLSASCPLMGPVVPAGCQSRSRPALWSCFKVSGPRLCLGQVCARGQS